jgi:glucokinase-like ROK family protein
MQSDVLTTRERPFAVGVDVGGTKIVAGVVDVNGQVYSRIKLPTDTSKPEMTLRSIANAIEQAIQAGGVSPSAIQGIGLGIPGQVDPQRGICLLSVNLNWHNVAVKDWLEQRFGLSCTLENDVSAGALGEYRYGGAANADILYLSLGTGIAARVIHEGHLYRGSHGLSGEIGHTIFVPGGPRCSCGGLGCLEALAGGPALARNAETRLQSGQTSCLQETLARQGRLSAEQVFEAARQEDALALQVLEEAGMHLAYAINVLAMTFDPQVVVLGGGLALEEGPLTEAIRRGLHYWLEQTPILREILTPESLRLSALQRDAGILGAAALIHI